MPRRKTSRVKRPRPERRLHLKVSSPRIVGFSCLRCLKRLGLLLILIGVLVSAGWGVKVGMRDFFIENDEFRLRHVDLETNGEMTEEHFRELVGLPPRESGESGERSASEASPSIFAIKLSDLRERLLERSGIVSAEVSRRLPGTLRVRVEERKPIAWLECRPLGIVGKNPTAGILLDKSGVCFSCDPWWEDQARPLPVLLVSQVEEGDVTVGKQLRHQEARRGLELLRLSQEVLAGEDWSLPVVAVRNDYSLEAATSSGVLATFGMYEHKRQLENLVTLLRVARSSGEPMAAVNLIPERNIPVIAGEPGSGIQENRLQREIQALLRH